MLKFVGLKLATVGTTTRRLGPKRRRSLRRPSIGRFGSAARRERPLLLS